MGTVRGEVCGEVFGEFFGEFFGLVLPGHSEQTQLQQKLQPKTPTTLHSKANENSGKNFMMRFCRGTPAKLSWVVPATSWCRTRRPPRQTKANSTDSRASSREGDTSLNSGCSLARRGYFSEFRVFSLEKTRRTNIGYLDDAGVFL